MEVFFYLMVIFAVIGAVLGSDTINAKLFYNNNPKKQFTTDLAHKRIWIGISQPKSKAEKIKVRFLGNPALELAKDLEIVSNGDIPAYLWQGYTYREILQEMSPELVKQVKQLRSFLV